MRKALLVITAALLVAAPGAYAQKPLTQIKVTQAVASFSFLPTYYARSAGFYKAEGLDVQQIATRGGGATGARDCAPGVSGRPASGPVAGGTNVGATGAFGWLCAGRCAAKRQSAVARSVPRARM